MKDKKDLFDLFKESEHKIQPTPSRHAWDKLERKLDARQDNNQTSKYRSIAQIAAVIAVVSIAAVIALLNMNSKTEMTASTATKNSTWEEIALEKSGKNGDDLVTFNKDVAAKQVLMNEGTADKKLVPKVNKAKSATNKIQHYEKGELVGDIDIATNTYAMHEAPLEREMLLGEVAINKNTTIEEIEQIALGANADGYVETNVKDVEVDAAMDEVAESTVLWEQADIADTDVVLEDVKVTEAVSPTTSAPAATSVPKYEITEVNAPTAKPDVEVGESNDFFTTRMDQITAADRRLEKSVAEASTKVRRKKKTRDIFNRNKAKRASDAMAPSSIGIAANASAAKEATDKSSQIITLYTLEGDWTTPDNSVQKRVSKKGSKLIFSQVGKTSNDMVDEFEFYNVDGKFYWLDKKKDSTYTFSHKTENTHIFKRSNDDSTSFVEIEDQKHEFILRTYDMGKNGKDKQGLKEEVFVRK